MPGRVVPLAWPIASTNLTAWAELLAKVKDGVLGSFDVAISGREDEVRRSESQRLMPGWNFCSFFLLKVLGRSSHYIAHHLHITHTVRTTGKPRVVL